MTKSSPSQECLVGLQPREYLEGRAERAALALVKAILRTTPPESERASESAREREREKEEKQRQSEKEKVRDEHTVQCQT